MKPSPSSRKRKADSNFSQSLGHLEGLEGVAEDGNPKCVGVPDITGTPPRPARMHSDGPPVIQLDSVARTPEGKHVEKLYEEFVSGTLFRRHFMVLSLPSASARLEGNRKPCPFDGTWSSKTSADKVSSIVTTWIEEEENAARVKRILHDVLGFAKECTWIAGEEGHPNEGETRLPDFLLFCDHAAKRDYADQGQQAPGAAPIAIVKYDDGVLSHDINLELRNAGSSWSRARIVIHTNGELWRLYMRNNGRLGEASDGLRYYEFKLGDFVRAYQSRGDVAVGCAGNWFTWLFSAQGIGSSPQDSLVHDAHRVTTRFVEGVCAGVFNTLGLALRHAAKFLHVACNRSFNEQELKMWAMNLIMRCIYLLMLEHKPGFQLEESIRLTRLIHTEVLGIGRKQHTMPTDAELWPKMARTFRAVKRADACNVQSPLLADIPKLDGSDALPAEMGHQRELSKALLNFSTARVERGEEMRSVDDKGVIDYGMLSIEHLGSIFERLQELSIVVKHTTTSGTINDCIETTERCGRAIETAGKSKVRRGEEDSERREYGAYFTHPCLVAHLSGRALLPSLDRILSRSQDWESFRRNICKLRIVDPAMGSGHFLVGAARLLRDALEEAVRRFGNNEDVDDAFVEAVDTCLFGVDLNPTSVELAKFAVGMLVPPDRPTRGLNMHLRHGDSLWGCVNVAHLVCEDGSEAARVRDALWPLGGASPASMAEVCARLQPLGSPLKDWPGGSMHDMEKWRLTRAYQVLKDAADERVGAPGGHCHFHWCIEFPCLFSAHAGNFDCVLGNPPWGGVTIKDVVIRSEMFEPFKIFLESECRRPEKGRMFTRGTGDRGQGQQMYFDLFVERSYQLSCGSIALVLPSAFCTSVRSAAARRLLHDGGCPFRSVHIFDRASATSLFQIDLPGICTILAVRGESQTCVISQRCTPDDMQGKECTMAASDICEAHQWQLMPIAGAMLKLSSIDSPKIKDFFTSLGGNRVIASGGKVLLTTCENPKPGCSLLLKGASIAAAFLLSESPTFLKQREVKYYEFRHLSDARQQQSLVKRIGVKHTVDATDPHKARAIILNERVNADDSMHTFSPKNALVMHNLDFFLAVFNSFVVDAFVRIKEGNGSNIAMGKYEQTPMPNVPLTLNPVFGDTSLQKWRLFCAAVKPKCNLLDVFDDVFTLANTTNIEDIVLVIGYGAAEQRVERHRWLERMPDQKGAAHGYLLPHAFQGGDDACDQFRRAQVALNHLVARCYGLSADELRELHDYVRECCIRIAGREAGPSDAAKPSSRGEHASRGLGRGRGRRSA